MNKYILKRVHIANTAILGKLLDGDKVLAYSLENPHRNSLKDSAIPAGIYKCIKDDVGKFRYWKLIDVFRRTNIEIHNGNYERDTEGCILFAGGWRIVNDQLALTADSIKTLEKLKKILPNEFELEIIE